MLGNIKLKISMFCITILLFVGVSLLIYEFTPCGLIETLLVMVLVLILLVDFFTFPLPNKKGYYEFDSGMED